MDESLRSRAREARAAITSGVLRGAALLEVIEAIPFHERDAWLDEVLGIAELPVDRADLPPGAVPYLPSGVEEILALVAEAPVGPDDELVDLGSGLGRAAILVHLLSGARTCGVEIQDHLVRDAQERCAQLALEAVTFVHGNAAALALDGSIFYLYAPFNGAMLASVVERLAAVARRRAIVVAAVGLELDAPWLRARPTRCASLTLYDGGTRAQTLR